MGALASYRCGLVRSFDFIIYVEVSIVGFYFDDCAVKRDYCLESLALV
jgi:hypothetical protein